MDNLKDLKMLPDEKRAYGELPLIIFIWLVMVYLLTMASHSILSNYHMESIRGTAENNIFAVGHFGFVAHYNGSTWHYYPELYRYAIASSVAVIGNSVFVVGTDGSQAFIYVGRRMG